MKVDKGIQGQESLTLKDNQNQNTPMIRKKHSTPRNLKLNLKEYISSFDLPKESNANNSFYENFLNHIQEDKKLISSCQLNNDGGEVKAIHVKNVNSNFMSVQKISFHKSGNNKTSKKSQNTGESKTNNNNNNNNEEERQQENVLEKDNPVIHSKQPKSNDNEEEQPKPKEETKQKKKLKVQRTKAPPQLIRKKNFIFCCIPVSKK